MTPSGSDDASPPARSDQAAQWDSVPGLLTSLWAIVDELQALFPERKFTLDGHLIGSIGECLAAYCFDLDLALSSTPSHDATTADGRRVEVKLTQGNSSINLTADPEPFPHVLLVFRLVRDGEPEVVYNGPACPAWDKANPRRKNNTRGIALSTLRALDASVEAGDRLLAVRPIPPIGKP